MQVGSPRSPSTSPHVTDPGASNDHDEQQKERDGSPAGRREGKGRCRLGFNMQTRATYKQPGIDEPDHMVNNNQMQNFPAVGWVGGLQSRRGLRGQAPKLCFEQSSSIQQS